MNENHECSMDEEMMFDRDAIESPLESYCYESQCDEQNWVKSIL